MSVMKILAIITIIISSLIFGAEMFLFAGIQVIGSFWGGGSASITPVMALMLMCTLIPTLLSAIALIALRRFPKARVATISVALAITLFELVIAFTTVQAIRGDIPSYTEETLKKPESTQ